MTAIEASTSWVESLLFGPVALSLMTLAVAVFGFRLLLGHGTLREAATILAGCFVLVGASQLSAFLRPDPSQTTYSAVSAIPLAAEPEPVRSLPRVAPSQSGPNPFSPYAPER